MNKNKNYFGMTLIELVLAIALGTSVLTALVSLFQPFLTGFIESRKFQSLRSDLVTPMDALSREIQSARALYYDPSQCYLYCLVNFDGKRTLYFWNNQDLVRKSEVASNPLSCDNAQVFSRSLDKINSFLTMSDNLAHISLAKTQSGSTYYQTTSVFPGKSERHTLFYDNFSCNTLNSQNWSFTTTSAMLGWELQASTLLDGKYWLYQNLLQNQAIPAIATAVVPLNLSRAEGGAILQLSYKTLGSLVPGETFKGEFFDGNEWHDLFLDDLLGNLKTLQYMTIDLSAYSLNANNKLRFTGTLKQTSNHWIIDEIEIFTK